jgi:SAM-dependent methyltransferase
MLSAMRVYDRGLLWGADARGGGAIMVRTSDGALAPLAIDRYLGAADATDELLLAGVCGPVLDVGCGPGRHLHALAHRGIFGLGVDLSPVAVSLARGGGAQAIVASVFDELPGARCWRTALLLDGNIGIGGDPIRLLRRIHNLLHPDGAVLAELDAPEARTGPIRARLESVHEASSWFPWARVAAPSIEQVAVQAGFTVGGVRLLDGRWFAGLVADRATTADRATADRASRDEIVPLHAGDL